jgi:hypothetical protein
VMHEFGFNIGEGFLWLVRRLLAFRFQRSVCLGRGGKFSEAVS